MTQKSFFTSIEDDMKEGLGLIKLKNKDYATESDPFKNFRTASLVGVNPERAMLLRVLEKLSRISNLVDKTNDVKDETIQDTIIDCCNYLYILNAYLKDKRK
jgi:hypothetical protein